MYTPRFQPTGILFVIPFLFATAAAQADIFDDILSIATAARDRATQARDNAATARDRATQARDNAASARDVAVGARDTAIEIRDTMRSGLLSLTGEMQSAINEAVEDFRRQLEAEVEGRDEFISSGAAELFRQKLIQLLQGLEDVVNTIYEVVEFEAIQVDFGRLMQVVEALPDRALYPLYRVLSVELNLFEDNGLLDRLVATPGRLRMSARVLDEPSFGNGGTSFLDLELASCNFVLNNYTDLKQINRDLIFLSTTLKLVGKVMMAAGETTIQGHAGLWGWVGARIENNPKKQFGEILLGVSETISAITGPVGVQLRHCAGVAIADEARVRENKILKLLDSGSLSLP